MNFNRMLQKGIIEWLQQYIIKRKAKQLLTFDPITEHNFYRMFRSYLPVIDEQFLTEGIQPIYEITESIFTDVIGPTFDRFNQFQREQNLHQHSLKWFGRVSTANTANLRKEFTSKYGGNTTFYSHSEAMNMITSIMSEEWIDKKYKAGDCQYAIFSHSYNADNTSNLLSNIDKSHHCESSTALFFKPRRYSLLQTDQNRTAGGRVRNKKLKSRLASAVNNGDKLPGALFVNGESGVIGTPYFNRVLLPFNVGKALTDCEPIPTCILNTTLLSPIITALSILSKHSQISEHALQTVKLLHLENHQCPMQRTPLVYAARSMKEIIGTSFSKHCSQLLPHWTKWKLNKSNIPSFDRVNCHNKILFHNGLNKSFRGMPRGKPTGLRSKGNKVLEEDRKDEMLENSDEEERKDIELENSDDETESCYDSNGDLTSDDNDSNASKVSSIVFPPANIRNNNNNNNDRGYAPNFKLKQKCFKKKFKAKEFKENVSKYSNVLTSRKVFKFKIRDLK